MLEWYRGYSFCDRQILDIICKVYLNKMNKLHLVLEAQKRIEQ